MHTTDVLPKLAPAIAEEILERLRAALPLPTPNTPATRAARDESAFFAISGLCPTDAAQASLAALIVAMQAHYLECLRQADLMRQDFKMADRFRAVGQQMMREVRGGLRLLRECQASANKAAAKPRPAMPCTADARRERRSRIRALNLRLIETPPTRH